MGNWKAYSDEEIQWLKDNYSTASWEVMESTLKRSKAAIIGKASKLGLNKDGSKNGNYTPYEDELIREVYENSDSTTLSDNLCSLIEQKLKTRTVKGLQTRAWYLGLCVRHKWTDEEDKFLIDHHLDMTVNELTSHLKKHNRNSVYNRIVKIKSNWWPNVCLHRR